jgi:hypothetical protein
MVRSGGENPANSRIIGVAGHAPAQHNANPNHAVSWCPFRDRFCDAWVGWIHRLNQSKFSRMRRVNRNGVTFIVAIHRPRRHEDGPVNANGVHCHNQIVAGHFSWSCENIKPRSFRVIAFISVDLRVNRKHYLNPFAQNTTST